jgi:hypothetical protein
MTVADLRRLKELEAENAKLKRIVGDQALDISALKDLLGRNDGPPRICKALDRMTGTVCINVSGLLQVGCGCSQATMRCARPVPIKRGTSSQARFRFPALTRRLLSEFRSGV